MGTLIGDNDKCLFDHIASEVNKLAGTTAIYYQFDEERSITNPLYNEVVEPEFRENRLGNIGVEIPVFFTNPEKTKIAGEEGLQTEKTADVTIAVADLESRSLRRPRVGDMFKIWDTFWDVRVSHRDGLLNDGPTTSVYRVELKRSTKSSPESLRMKEGV